MRLKQNIYVTVILSQQLGDNGSQISICRVSIKSYLKLPYSPCPLIHVKSTNLNSCQEVLDFATELLIHLDSIIFSKVDYRIDLPVHFRNPAFSVTSEPTFGARCGSRIWLRGVGQLLRPKVADVA